MAKPVKRKSLPAKKKSVKGSTRKKTVTKSGNAVTADISNYKTIQIRSLEDFITEVTKFKEGKNYVWFRGHCSNNYKLQPSIYRSPFSPDDEDFFTSKFKSKAIPFLSSLPQKSSSDDSDYWEWLFIMQHYKIPTRLLDWSESALIALAFAVMFRKHEDKDIRGTGAHVWCIDPVKCNSVFQGLSIDYVPNITENVDAQQAAKKTTDRTNKLHRPVAIYGPQNSRRIAGQKGGFTVFPNNDQFSFDDYITDDIAIKIEIPSDKEDKIVKDILRQLYLAGMSESIVYPELDSVSTEIVNELVTIKEKK